MTCSRCGSSNVQAVPNTRGKIKRRGCLSVCFHVFMTIITAGLWIIIPLIRGGSRGKIKTKIEFVCLNCGAKVRP